LVRRVQAEGPGEQAGCAQRRAGEKGEEEAIIRRQLAPIANAGGISFNGKDKAKRETENAGVERDGMP
jgi:hypothetical protein